ncbi:MAG: hypothetical protein RMJ98_20885 [Myxococcales bacterium]|nr:hypothetical protein [Polyangiaceae bacterium]MDW8251759.1 hypothetical protein [Myxococcales bacterium]
MSSKEVGNGVSVLVQGSIGEVILRIAVGIVVEPVLLPIAVYVVLLLSAISKGNLVLGDNPTSSSELSSGLRKSGFPSLSVSLVASSSSVSPFPS